MWGCRAQKHHRALAHWHDTPAFLMAVTVSCIHIEKNKEKGFG